MEQTKTGEARTTELYASEDGRESRVVTLVRSGEWTVFERTRGDLTELCYGQRVHGHRVSFAPAVGAQALEVDEAELGRQVVGFFAEGAYLSDLQDLLDRRGLPYSYATWLGGGVSFRGAAGVEA